MRILVTALAIIAIPIDGRLSEKTPASTPYVLHVESIRLVHAADSATITPTARRHRTTTLGTPAADSDGYRLIPEKSKDSPHPVTVAAYVTASHSATLAPSTPAPNRTTLDTAKNIPRSSTFPIHTATVHAMTVAGSAAMQRLKRSGPPAEVRALKTRIPRDSKPPKETQTKPNVVVKKPIPKFNEVDYDEDFQAKLLKSKTRHINSNEREEEDFNLNDYDFDVNHDEFAGKLKPMDPESKIKIKIPELDGDTEIVEIVTKPAEKAIKRRVPENKKKAKSDENQQKRDSEMKDDFYDEKPKRMESIYHKYV